MSKAFTRESDEPEELPVLPPVSASLPPGVKNYITPDGARRSREELDRLIQSERPRLAAEAETSGDRRQLLALDQRIAHLHQALQSAEVVPPPSNPEDKARFGATVTVRDETGQLSRYRIVGVDEADPDRDWVSWRSPIAKALLNARVGQKVRLRVPDGEKVLEILSVGYE